MRKVPHTQPSTFAIRMIRHTTENCKRACLFATAFLPTLKTIFFENISASTKRIYVYKQLIMNEHQQLTKCINHWAHSASFKCVTLNKLCSGLTVKCFEMPNASYTNR